MNRFLLSGLVEYRGQSKLAYWIELVGTMACPVFLVWCVWLVATLLQIGNGG